jgi:hypothetical protein
MIVAAICASSGALAQSGSYTATLVQPLDTQKNYVIGDNLWRCAGSTCTLISKPRDASSLRSCRQLQRQVGPLSAYGASEQPFDADRLTKCNAKG